MERNKNGCPQGSNLGPLLWNIYQNDLFYLSRASSLSMYADDHQLYFAHSNVKNLMGTIRSEGDQMSSWYQENHSVGNTSKYQAMVIDKKHEPSLTSVDINGHTINTTQELKLLGVTIDKELHFSKNISIICKKVNKLRGVLMRLRRRIPTEAELRIYKTAI